VYAGKLFMSDISSWADDGLVQIEPKLGHSVVDFLVGLEADHGVGEVHRLAFRIVRPADGSHIAVRLTFAGLKDQQLALFDIYMNEGIPNMFEDFVNAGL
jgi:hypothetical protein